MCCEARLGEIMIGYSEEKQHNLKLPLLNTPNTVHCTVWLCQWQPFLNKSVTLRLRTVKHIKQAICQ